MKKPHPARTPPQPCYAGAVEQRRQRQPDTRQQGGGSLPLEGSTPMTLDRVLALLRLIIAVVDLTVKLAKKR